MEVSELYRKNIFVMKKEKGIGPVRYFFTDWNRWMHFGRKWMKLQNFRCWTTINETIFLYCIWTLKKQTCNMFRIYLSNIIKKVK